MKSEKQKIEEWLNKCPVNISSVEASPKTTTQQVMGKHLPEVFYLGTDIHIVIRTEKEL